MTVESESDQVAVGHVPSGSVDLTRTVAQPPGAVWQALISAPGAAVWLGEGAVLGGKGESYHCADGTMGVVRSYHPLEQLRVSWHADESAPSSLIEVDLAPDGDDATLVTFRHDHIADAALRDRLEERWRERLDALAAFAGG